MGSSKKITSMGWIAFFIVIFVIVGGLMYYVYFFTPKNALELYQEISFSNDFEEVQKLMLEGHEENFKEVDFNFIKDNSANRVGQFTLFEFEEKTFVIMTTPGAKNLKVLEVEELPEDIRGFFLELAQ
ncbi:hypothetical protein ACMGD3_24690 [Lysinibacillus sphaericus]|uniref:hypothetical protein n=1 Tax=Lysinibacillus sphaericus TaxID=1421 RepID=UPI00296FAE95